jgi:hypothetical protein
MSIYSYLALIVDSSAAINNANVSPILLHIFNEPAKVHRWCSSVHVFRANQRLVFFQINYANFWLLYFFQLLHTVLADVGKDRALRIVRLSGQVHSTDRLALRQLNVDDVADWQMADRSKSTIVIVDQLEMFAQRGNQILLYKLLDACQHSSVLFIGVSCRHVSDDVVHMHIYRSVYGSAGLINATVTTQHGWANNDR